MRQETTGDFGRYSKKTYSAQDFDLGEDLQKWLNGGVKKLLS